MVNGGHPVELRSFWYRQQPCLVAHDERRQRCILATTTCGKKCVKARCCKMLPEVLTQLYIGYLDICKWPLRKVIWVRLQTRPRSRVWKGMPTSKGSNWKYVSFLLQLSDYLVYFHICTVLKTYLMYQRLIDHWIIAIFELFWWNCSASKEFGSGVSPGADGCRWRCTSVRRCSGLLGFNCVDINLQTVQSSMLKLFRFILGVHGSHEQIISKC